MASSPNASTRTGTRSTTDMNLLFICGKNRLRSPTAEHVFSQRQGIDVASAGVDRDADERVSVDLLKWADVILVMEKRHAAKLRSQHGQYLKNQRIICLDIKDRYGYMDPELVELLERKVAPLIR